MKIKSRLPLAIFISIIFCVVGCNDNSSEESVGRYCQECKNLNNQVNSLVQKNKELLQELNNVIAERDKAVVAQKAAEENARNRYTFLAVIAYIALGVGLLLIGSFILLIKSSSKNMTKETIDSLHCPRCGWEYAAGETICKNCKTHF